MKIKFLFSFIVWKCLIKSEVEVAILVFQSARKHKVENVEILLPVKICWNLFNSITGEDENVSQSEARVANLVFWSARTRMGLS